MQLRPFQVDDWEQRYWIAPEISIVNLPSEIVDAESWVHTLSWFSAPCQALKITTLLIPVKLQMLRNSFVDLGLRLPCDMKEFRDTFLYPDYHIRRVRNLRLSLAVIIVKREDSIHRTTFEMGALVIKQIGRLYERVGTYWADGYIDDGVNLETWLFSMFSAELGCRLETCYII